MDLAGFQEQLSKHYTRLRELRASENYAVYAIEHGLSEEDRSAARALLNDNLSSARRADRSHWLVWIAAAAEVGYQYDGTEYWDSFGAAFHDWPRFGDRNQIRTWYKRFATEFHGLAPSGPWARQFPIIAWPITQAILPRYLQRHFADHLYELRHALSRTGELTLQQIGELLSDRYYGSSSRFEGFLQQKVLTARIVMALQLEGVEDSVSPIEKATLDRIVADFDRLGSHGARLREAQRALRKTQFINSSKPGYVPPNQAIARPAEDLERVQRPRLLARPLDSDTWSLSIAIPDLATPMRKAGLSPRDLEYAKMRFRFFDEGSAWMPARGLFSYTGETEEPLRAYPSTDRAIFEFQHPLAGATDILNGRLHLPADPIRVLKVRADGIASELFGHQVRANQSYVVAGSAEMPADIAKALSLTQLKAGTSGVNLWLLAVPGRLDAAQIAALQRLGLGYSLAVRAEPLGLSPRWRPADDALVLLDTEDPMFCLTSDVAVAEYAVTVDAGPATRVKAAAGTSTMISLGTLAPGEHQVMIAALGTAAGQDIISEHINIKVRPTSPWQISIAGRAGVALCLEPANARLEQFVDGAALIRATAPPGRAVTLSGRFFAPDGALIHDEVFGRYDTSISDLRLSTLVVQKLTSNAMVQTIERASRIEVLISLDEFGSERVAFEKEAEPLRWLRVNERTVRLSDDTALAVSPDVERYDLDAVDAAQNIDYQAAIAGVELRGKGGLFVATLEGRRYEVVATALQDHLSDFGDLGVPASVSARAGRPKSLINALKRWHAARRLIGPMAYIARRNAINALENHLERSLCGAEWQKASGRVRAGTRQIGDLYGRVYYSRGFAAGLRSFDWRYESDRAAAESEFLRLVSVYHLPADDAQCRLALKLAFRPHAVSSSDLPAADTFETLKESAVVRGAYFARLAADLRAQDARAEAA